MNEEWHLSKYNLFAKIPNEDKIGCINLLKGTYSILTYEGVYRLSSGEINQYFIDQGFIVNYNELEALELLSRKSCGLSNTINLTICPTMNCNFDCSYCFEKHRTGKMSTEVQESIINFIKKTIKNGRIKFLNITWFGGEPLLAVDVIENLSKRIIEVTNQENVKYYANIITNGYLLTQEIVDKLSNVKINSYQITLDGIGDIHNKTRHLINKEPTFDKIISNLVNIKFKGIVNIRHNLYADNTEEVEPLREYVKELAKKSGNNIFYYPAFTHKNNNALEKEEQINYLNIEDFGKYEINKKIQNFTTYNGSYCGAHTLNFIVVDELGNLYRCWEDSGDIKKSYGKIEKWDMVNPIETATNPQILIDYINTGGAIRDKECLECVWLPICQGGCPHNRLFYNKVCISYKNNLEDFVLKFIDFKERQKQNKLNNNNNNNKQEKK